MYLDKLDGRISQDLFDRQAASMRVEQAGLLRKIRRPSDSLFEPFEILRHSNQESYRNEKEKTGSGREIGIWLPGTDSNHDSRVHHLLILASTIHSGSDSGTRTRKRASRSAMRRY
jgi:hypothetical protein